MKQALLLLTLAINTMLYGQSGIFESYAVLSLNGGADTWYDLQASTGNPDFNGNNLGNFTATGSLVVKGGQNKTFKCAPCDITNGEIYYRVYPSSSPSGAYTSINLPWNSNLGSGCGGNDQQWESTSGASNVLTGLAPGNYTLEVYTQANYQGCGTGTHYSNNGGANYKATFNYCGPAAGALPAGTYSIPGCFATIQSAVGYLNTNGISGAVVFDVAAGHTETLSGKLTMTATGTASNTITFQKSGSGANPRITSYTGTIATPAVTADGFWVLAGSDYVTIDGIDLQEAAGNTTTTTVMEFGFGLFKASVTDGCQNITIKNCVITLNRVQNTTWTAPGHQGSTGIAILNGLHNATGVITPTAASGSNSFNKFYSNTIQNCNAGIVFVGYVDPTSPFNLADTDNEIGGTTIGTGNSILNFGGGAATNPATGIFMGSQKNVNCQYNIINNNNGSGVNHAATLRGIFWQSTFAGSSGTCSNNIVSVNSGATTSQLSGIEVSCSANSAQTINVNNNTVTTTYTTATSGITYGIYTYTGTPGTLNVNSNTVYVTTKAASAVQYAIWNSMAAVTTLNMNSNTVSGMTFTASPSTTSTVRAIYCSGGANTCATSISSNTISGIDYTGTTGGSGEFSAIYHSGTPLTANISSNNFNNLSAKTTGVIYLIYNSYTAPANGSKTVANNLITTGFTRAAAGTGAFYGYYDNGSSPSTVSHTINGNNFSNVNTNITNSGVVYGIYSMDYSGSNPTLNVYSNTITNYTVGSGSTIAGLYLGGFAGSTGTPNGIYNNTISGFSLNGSGTFYGIYQVSAALYIDIYGNTIHSHNSTGSSSMTGIFVSGATNQTQAYRNNIYGISAATTSTGINGIYLTGAPVQNVYNNFVSNLSAPGTNATVAVNGIYVAGGTAANLSYNTIKLGSTATPLTSSNTNFGATGVYYSSTTNTTLNNNIINLNITPKGTGTASCVRRSAVGTANTAPTASSFITNNNVYYVNPGAWNFLYAEGTVNTTGSLRNAYGISGITVDATNNIKNDPDFNTSCSLYKAFMLTNGRTASIADASTFFEDNLVAGSPTGTFAPSGASYAENGAVANTVTTDFDGTNRTPTNDIGARQFAGSSSDAVAPAITYTPATLFPNTTSVCNFTVSIPITDASTGVNTTAGTRPRIWFKKASDATNAIAATNTSADFGWKWVEASNTTSPFSFTIDYSILDGGSVTSGDVIQYFVVAQDNVGTPNVGTSAVTYNTGFCPTSVALAAGGFPVTAINSYTITSGATSGTATAGTASICISGTTSLDITPIGGSLTGLTYQWQSSPVGSGTFTNITGGITLPYVAAVTSSTDFQCVVKDCAGATLFTSSIVSVTGINPVVVSTTPGNRCGTGTVTLGATAGGGGTLNWYAAASGGSALGTGSTFTTPSISASTVYYAAAEVAGTPSTGEIGTATTLTGATVQPTAFCNRWSQYKMQILYTAAELSSAGLTAGRLTSVAFNISTLGSAATNANFEISMGTTGSSSLTTTYLTGLTSVYGGTGTTYTHSASGWQTITLATPFDWDGSSNLVIEVKHDGANSTNNARTYYTATAGNMLVYNISDNSASTGTTSTNRLNVQFGFTPVCASGRTAVGANINTAPTISISPASATICSGQSQGISVTSSNDPNYTYTWDNGLAAGATQSVSPASTTTYNVTATDASGTGTFNGCVATGSVVVTVNALPTGVSASASSTTVCNGSTVTLNGTPTTTTALNFTEGFESGALGSWSIINAGSGNDWTVSTSTTWGGPRTGTNRVRYLYNSSNAANAHLFSPAQTLQAGVTYTISFWYQTDGYDENLKLTVGNAATVAAQTTVIQDFGAVRSDLGSANFTQVVLTFTPATTGTYYFDWHCYSAANMGNLDIDDISITAPAATYTYSWTSTPAGFTSAIQNPTGVTPTSGIVYNLVVSNAAGCSATASTAAITVNPLPSAPTATNSSQCGTQIPTASVTSTAGVAGSGTFNWYDAPTAGTLLQSSSSSTYTNNIATTTTMYVSELGTNGCESARTAVTVTVVSPPSISISPASAAICIGQSQAFSVSSSNDPNYTYTWDNGLAAGSSQSVSPASTTTFTVTATDASGTGTFNGCATTSTITVTVNPLPVIAALQVTPTTTCSGDPVVLLAGSVVSSNSNYTVGTFSIASNAAATPYRSGVGLANQAKIQYLFTAAELTAAGLTAGNINALRYNVTNAGTGTLANYTIQLANVSNTSLTTTFINSGLTTVFGPSSVTPTLGVNTHTLSSPYYWDGTSSLLISICHSGAGGTAATVDCNQPVNMVNTSSGANACSGSIGTLQSRRPIITFNLSPNNNSDFTWTWNPGAINANTTTVNPTNMTTSPVVYGYSVTALNNATGCSVTSTVQNVTVNYIPSTPTATNSTQCGTQIPSCFVTSTSGAASPVFRWYTVSSGGTAIAGESGASLTAYSVSALGTTSFYVSEVNGSCESPRVQVDVLNNTPPALTVSAVSPTICLGSTTDLSASGTGYTTFNWSGAALSSTSGSPVTASPTATGTYNVTATGGGCIITGSVSVTVNPAPPTSTGATICAGGTGELSSASTCVGYAVNNNITLADIPASGAPTYVRSSSGTTYTASGNVSYTTVTIRPTLTGSYLFNGCGSGDTHMQLYSGTFNPASPSTNYVISDDDANTTCTSDPRITRTLTAGQEYILVYTPFSGTAGVTGITITVTPPAGGDIETVTTGVLQWYTASTSGTLLGTGSPFNPVGVAGSGLTDTETPGTYTYYAACSTNPDCRTATDFVINNCIFTDVTGTCTGSATTTGVNGSSWFHIVDGSGNRIASVNPQGNNLGDVTAQIMDFVSVPTDNDATADCPTAPGQPYLPRYFNLNCTGTNPFSSPVKVRLYFLNQELDDFNAARTGYGCSTIARNSLEVFHYDGNAEDCDLSNNAYQSAIIPASAVTDATFGSSAFYLEVEVNSFSEFGSGSGAGNPLPIELSYFTANKVGESAAQLNWETITEKDNDYFLVERSQDGLSFERIGMVDGNGTTLETHNYGFRDVQPLAGVNYYRLRQVDFDGSSTNSNVVALEFAREFSVKVFPNPMNNYVKLNVYTEQSQDLFIEMFDMTGRVLYSQNQAAAIGNNLIEIETATLAAGTYMIRVTAAENTVTNTVIKN